MDREFYMTGDIEAASEFGSRAAAIDAAHACQMKVIRVVRHPAYANHPEDDGGFLVEDAEHSGPGDPSFLALA